MFTTTNYMNTQRW